MTFRTRGHRTLFAVACGLLFVSITGCSTSPTGDDPDEAPIETSTELGGITLLERDGARLLVESELPEAVLAALFTGRLDQNDQGCMFLTSDGSHEPVGTIFPYGTKLAYDGVELGGGLLKFGEVITSGGGNIHLDPESEAGKAAIACGFDPASVNLIQGQIVRR